MVHLCYCQRRSAFGLEAFPLTVIISCYYPNQIQQTKRTFSDHQIVSSKRNNVDEYDVRNVVPFSMIAWLMYNVSLILHFNSWWWVMLAPQCPMFGAMLRTA